MDMNLETSIHNHTRIYISTSLSVVKCLYISFQMWLNGQVFLSLSRVINVSITIHTTMQIDI
jgi:hypothetical protein